ncbi:MAG: hypothetical protein R3C20_12570 [Planctomycetaceae bacterium]
MTESGYDDRAIDQAILQSHRTKNSVTSACAIDYVIHRQIVTQLIRKSAETTSAPVESRTLMLLGAGNCLDVDLRLLGQMFTEIHLVDLDENAVNAAADRHPQLKDKLRIHAPVDIAWPLCDAAMVHEKPDSQDTASTKKLAWLQQLQETDAVQSLPRCDVVVSLCLFSQLVDSLSQILGQRHEGKDGITRTSIADPQALELAVQALRKGHLSRMKTLCHSAGQILFVTDVVSSSTLPELSTTQQSELPNVLKQAFAKGNFFTGCHPDRTSSDFAEIVCNGDRTRMQITAPWIWMMGSRHFACYALTGNMPE